MDSSGRNPWSSIKTQRTMSMTLDAWNLLGELSTTADLSRSEVLEVMIRMSHKEGFDASTGKTDLLYKKPEEVAIPT